MQKSALLIIPLLVLFLSTSNVSAQNASSSASPRSDRAVVAQQVKDAREKRKEDILKNLTATREKIASRAALLKQKFAGFKDQQKAVIAERLNNSLNRVNLTRTENMNKNLDKMEEILAKVDLKVSGSTKSAQATGSATPSAQATNSAQASASAAVLQARTAIDNARAAVATQSTKDYTLLISSESAVKKEASASRKLLNDDLKKTHNLVVIARSAVANAIKTSASFLGGIGNGR